jgi:hypothetical protein
MEEKPLLTIKSFPLLRYWKKGIFGFSIILFTTIVVFLKTENVIFVVVSFFLLSIPVSSFFIPVRFEFFDDYYTKTELGKISKINYEIIKSFSVGKSGIEIVKKRKRNKFEHIFIEDNEIRLNLQNFLKSRINV